ncbi:hypothetical protein F441_20596 [Phytophthora nicotianae CJ01A1]|uniref:Cystatin domain-containing protein n=4 Tax=Phytophthora nicotianae TaxID=4792 RepID=W2Y782_PHYNI|nr:hypothetical protein L915_20142 [Phytophthora nicotianae]ETO61216.1 hypothetical protein F444_20744 [Phytophthora nicotianae P1976]ETP02328.1 hypothetical protein F441_20596 [Phytophthora nicotianae CJ01A1]ETP30498.1 hypothetical protein F442_20523 [Phytophthora nicotianae P10297]KUF87887.1 Fructokinase [Phytophthora nicotianae]
MTFLRYPLALLACTALVATSAQMSGAYSKKEITQEDMDVLHKAKINENTFNYDVNARICYLNVESLETQVVSGTNYKFLVSGCNINSEELGPCSNANCEASKFDIVIYSQPSTNTLELTSVTLVN